LARPSCGIIRADLPHKCEIVHIGKKKLERRSYARGLKALVNRLADLIAAASVAFGRDRRGWMIDVSVVRVHQHGACVAQNERRAANRTKTTDQQDKAE
jgi:hypothetical protein